MNVRIELNENDLKLLVKEYLYTKLGEITIDDLYLKIETKSAQNYKSEWEKAHYRAVYDGPI